MYNLKDSHRCHITNAWLTNNTSNTHDRQLLKLHSIKTLPKKNYYLFKAYRIYSHNSRTFLTKILYLNLGCVIYARKRFYVNKSGYTGNFLNIVLKSVNYAMAWITRVNTVCVIYIYIYINLLNPTGHVMHHQFNIQQLYALPTLYLCVLCLSENKQRLVPLTA